MTEDVDSVHFKLFSVNLDRHVHLLKRNMQLAVVDMGQYV